MAGSGAYSLDPPVVYTSEAGLEAGIGTLMESEAEAAAHDVAVLAAAQASAASLYVPLTSHPMLDYGSPAHLGVQADVPTALSLVRSKNWDSANNGTGWFQQGHRFTSTADGQDYYQDAWGLWGEANTVDNDLIMGKFPWTDAAGSGSITDAGTHVVLSGGAGSGCTWVGGATSLPYRYLAVPPCSFRAIVTVTTVLTGHASEKFAGIGVLEAAGAGVHVRSEIINKGVQWEKRRVLNGVEAGLTGPVVSTCHLAISHKHEPGGNTWTTSHGATVSSPPKDSDIWVAPTFQDVEQAGLGATNGVWLVLFAGHGDAEPPFEFRFSDLYFWREA